MSDDSSVSADVAAWFEASPWGRKAPSQDHHTWVELLAGGARWPACNCPFKSVRVSGAAADSGWQVRRRAGGMPVRVILPAN